MWFKKNINLKPRRIDLFLKKKFMKRIIAIVLLLAFLNPATAQTCEERESKLLYIFGGTTAMVMYNTYAFIGAVCDAYAKETYDSAFATQLLAEQIVFIGNQLKISDTLINANYVKSKEDREFFTDYIGVLKGIQSQAQHYNDYIKTKSALKQMAYNDQRQQNWAEIKRLLGIN
jgi:hypothetical protein